VSNRTVAFPRVPERREPLVPSGVLGMLLFVFSEVMLFAGLMSAHAITKASIRGGEWPPLGQPRLPVGVTAVNTLLLLSSGVALYLGGRAFLAASPRARAWLSAALALGALFVTIQGVEWVRLVHEGLTLTSSSHGSFFYLIIGLHGLHAIAAIAGLGWTLGRLLRGRLAASQLQTAQVFWYFVVGIWPLLYWRVYL
jgi:heme/copper-type cytochrome/quinol oxidase subunit 3